MNNITVAVVGATGAVGEVMVELLGAEALPVGRLLPLASERSLGQSVSFRGRDVAVMDLAECDFEGVDYALFSAGGAISEQYAPRAAAAGAVVIDNSSVFRQAPDIPLVIPEVNPHALAAYEAHRIIANPNCSTIQMLVALAPIHARFGLRRIDVATYQSVSGAGRAALEELARQTAQRLNFQEVEPQAFPQPMAFNVLPQIDRLEDNGFSREEMKMRWETRKILETPDLPINATCVRVPVFYGHAEAVRFEVEDAVDVVEIRDCLRDAPGVQLVETVDPAKHPTPVTHAAGTDPVYVGRLRADLDQHGAFNLWVVSDNLRKGAALNAVQILSGLLELRDGQG